METSASLEALSAPSPYPTEEAAIGMAWTPPASRSHLRFASHRCPVRRCQCGLSATGLAYRWFTRLDLEQEVPDHSTFSKNRHGRFRQSGMFRKVFEEIVQRCLEVGLVAGKNLAVDGTLMAADARRGSRIPRKDLPEAAQLSKTVEEYLGELEQENPVSKAELVSTADPDAILATHSLRKNSGPYQGTTLVVP